MSTSAATNPFGPQDPADVVARLYTEYADDLTRYCRGQLRSSQEAEDAVQTTFVHAVQALRRGVVPECESAWLYTIAKNVCHDQRRANGPRLVLATELEAEEFPARESADAELTDNLNDALAQLPERQRRAFLLCEWRGLSSHEVARSLGLRDAETYALLTRARRSMASMLAVTTGRTTLAIHLGPLLLKLRALFAGGAAKTAAAATLVVAVAGGGLVVGQQADPGPEAAAFRANRASARENVRASATAVTRDAGALAAVHAAEPPARASVEPTRRTVTRQVTDPGVAPSPGPSSAPVAGPTDTGTATTTRQAAAPSTLEPASRAAKRVVPKLVPRVQRAARRVRLPDVTVPNVPDLLQPVESPVDALIPPVTDVVGSVENTVPPLPEVQLPSLPVVPPVPPLPPPPLLP